MLKTTRVVIGILTLILIAVFLLSKKRSESRLIQIEKQQKQILAEIRQLKKAISAEKNADTEIALEDISQNGRFGL